MDTKMAAKELEEVDDLLTSILIRLPPKSVFKFRYVSKKWNKIIEHPLFLKNYPGKKWKQRLLGCIEIPRSNTAAAKIFPTSQTNMLKPSGIGSYIHTSDGLVLCSQRARYYVVNPLTNAQFILPPRSFSLWQMGLTCNDNMQELAPSFKVIGFLSDYTASARQRANTLVIGTYSSTTGKWTTSTLSGPAEMFRLMNFNPKVYVFNGVFHWQGDDNIIAVYDSKRTENHIQLIKEPPRNGNRSFTFSRSSKDDRIWAGETSDSIITVWMLPKEDEYRTYRQSTTIPKEEWIMAHKISKDSLMLENYLTPYKFLYLDAMVIGDTVTAILRGGARVFIYDIKRESIELDSPISEDCRSLVPYMEPSLSSYALSTSIN